MTENGEGGGTRFVEIHIRGQIDKSWGEWLEGLEVCPAAEGMTILRGPIRDQSALYGIIARLRDLGLELLSIEHLE
jgi:hypothetical protein